MNEPKLRLMTIYFILLTASGLAGGQEVRAGTLSLEHEGSRHRVTCEEIFEWVFYEENGGCVREWYDILNDPERNDNIIAGAIAGAPQVLFHCRAEHDDVTWVNSMDDISDHAGEHFFGVMEESTVRLKLRSVSHMCPLPDEGSEHDGDSIITQTYTIYTDGKVFVHQTVQRREGAGAIGEPGQYRPMQFGIGYEQEEWNFGTDLEDPAEDPERLRAFADGDATAWAVYSDDPALRTDLLVTLFTPWPALDVLRRHSGICWRRNNWEWPPGHSETFNLMLLLAQDITSVDERLWVVRDYQNPDSLTMEVGAVVDDGFSEDEGCYMVEASDNSIRLYIGGSTYDRFHPAFLISGYRADLPDVKINDVAATPGDDYLASLLPEDRLIVHLMRTIEDVTKVEIAAVDVVEEEEHPEQADIAEWGDPDGAIDVPVDPADAGIDTVQEPAVDNGTEHGDDSGTGHESMSGGCSCSIAGLPLLEPPHG